MGRPLSKSEWERMGRQVAKLKTYLDRVSFDWDEEGQPSGEVTDARDGDKLAPVPSEPETPVVSRIDCDSGEEQQCVADSEHPDKACKTLG